MQKATTSAGLCLASIILVGISSPARADLIGTNVSLGSLYQQTINSSPINTTTTVTVPVSASAVEFPSVAAYEIAANLAQANLVIVDNAVDIGATTITETFQNSGDAGASSIGAFATAYKNDSVYTFQSSALVNITGASVDSSSTLGITNSDLTFAGDQLFVNYSGVPYNPMSRLEIDLLVSGGPDGGGTPSSVPEPSSLALLAIGLAALNILTRRNVAW